MNYYKMFKDTNFIGIINSNNFYEYNKYNKLFFSVKESAAQCIFYNNNMYRISGMQPLPSNFECQYVELIPTTETEYEEFRNSIENDEPIEIVYPTQPIEPEPNIEPQPQPEQPKMTIQQMRDKIAQQDQQIKALTAYILGLE